MNKPIDTKHMFLLKYWQGVMSKKMNNKIELLWKIIDSENIDLLHYPLRNTPEKALGLYIRDNNKSIIIIDDTLDENGIEYGCVLAHEVGHFFTTPRTSLVSAHTCYGNEVAMGKDEHRATVWATDFYIPDTELIEAVLAAGANTISQLAEQLFVADWFIYRKIFIIKMRLRTMGIKLKIRDLLKPEIYEKYSKLFKLHNNNYRKLQP